MSERIVAGAHPKILRYRAEELRHEANRLLVRADELDRKADAMMRQRSPPLPAPDTPVSGGRYG